MRRHLQFTYHRKSRLVATADELGQVTTLAYGHAMDPLKITRVTDPFGRTTRFTYDEAGQLASITDVVGMTSSFTYVDDYLVGLTTPYGTTAFRHERGPSAGIFDPWVEAVDPLGGQERLEFRWAGCRRLRRPSRRT